MHNGKLFTKRVQESEGGKEEIRRERYWDNVTCRKMKEKQTAILKQGKGIVRET